MKRNILVNHIGFLPGSAKFFVVEKPGSHNFSIKNRWDGAIVFAGNLAGADADIGGGYKGDFSDVTQEGTYVIACGNDVSRVVVIHKSPYEMALRILYHYFPFQRCGDSKTGWNAPCHLDDAVDVRSGQRVDVTGGWHQSCDLRKWGFGTSMGLTALSELGTYEPLRACLGDLIEEELRWGNRYFHKMIRPDGGMMDFVVNPNSWAGPRQLMSNDASTVSFFNLLIGQCKAALFLKDRDPAYSGVCMEKALTLWNYVRGTGMPRRYEMKPFKYHEYLPELFRKSFVGSSLFHGNTTYAAMQLYSATGDDRFLDIAAGSASRYCAFQAGGRVEEDLASACFWIDGSGKELDTSPFDGLWGPLGLCWAADALRGHGDREKWIGAIRKIARQAILSADKNPWGLVPVFWEKEKTGGGRPGGSMYYHYFTKQADDPIGLNFAILTKALFLIKAAGFTPHPSKCFEIAQRQVDWILGCNPFDASTCEGIGYNQEPRLINPDEFIPPVPQIPGAVQTGISSLPGEDIPRLGSECGVTTEYDMPPTALLIWTLCELLKAKGQPGPSRDE